MKLSRRRLLIVGVARMGRRRLKPVQVSRSALGVSGRGEDSAFITFENFEPVGDIRSMILANFRGQG